MKLCIISTTTDFSSLTDTMENPVSHNATTDSYDVDPTTSIRSMYHDLQLNVMIESSSNMVLMLTEAAK